MVNNKELEPIGGTISVVNVPVAMLTASNMPMRDYFAAKAMQGLLSSGSGNILAAPTAFARDAYAVADAMLAAREQK